MDIQKPESQIKILRDHMTLLCVSHCSQGTQDKKIEQIKQCKGHVWTNLQHCVSLSCHYSDDWIQVHHLDLIFSKQEVMEDLSSQT